MELVIKHFKELSLEELVDIYKFRVEVFVVEQKCPYQEVDDADKEAYHLYLKDEEGIQAYARVLPAGLTFEENSIGRVITRKRRCGLGSKIVNAAIEVAKEKFDAKVIKIGAQVYTRGLYEKAGFRQISDVFMEDGIPHILMEWTKEANADIGEQLKEYIPYNEQEEKDQGFILKCMKEQENIFFRENEQMHMTASAWVVNKDRDKVLMAYHNIYDSWSWLGGHADGEEDLLKVAMKEVQEESGVSHVRPVSEDIYSLEVLTVDGHEKRGRYVSSHLHLNVTYLLEADEEEVLRVKEDENSQVAWFSLEDAIEASTEPWFQERIYRKLNEKLEK